MSDAPVVKWKRYTQTAGRDDYNRPIAGYLDPVVIDADFAPESTTEPRDGSSHRVISDAKLILDDPIDYDQRDRFTVAGDEYDVEGKTQGWVGRYSGMTFGQEIRLRKVTG